jgi:hypothetical protein
MELKQGIIVVNRHKILLTFATFDGHTLVMQWGLIDRTASGTVSVEHHDIIGVISGADSI